MATISSAASGNWSATGTWTGGVVPGDGDFVNIGAHAITIDQDIGTVVGGGINRIQLTSASGSLLFAAAGNYTIIFNSTGTDPIGTGTAAAPADDATMFGIFNAIGGKIQLAGTSSGTLTITTADDTNPWYLYHVGAASATSGDFTLTWCDIRHCGTNSTNFRGVEFSCQFGSKTATISHCKFTDLLTIQWLGSNATHVTITYNYFTGTRANIGTAGITGTITGLGTPNDVASGNGVVVTDNTEVSPVNNSWFWATTYIPNTSPNYFQRNVVVGTSSAAKGLIIANRSINITDNIAYNTNSTFNGSCHTIFTGLPSTTDTTTITGNYISGALAASIYVSGTASAPTISGNFIAARAWSSQQQGAIFVSHGKPVVTTNILLYEDVSASTTTVLYLGYTNALNDVATLFYHNTILAPHFLTGAGYGYSSLALSVGEPGFPSYTNIVRDNIFAGWGTGALYDTSGNTWVANYNGVGTHHNAFYVNSTDYVQPTGQGEANFWDGVNPHPSAVYGEITGENPNFVNDTLRIENWDTSLGGNGTIANVADEFANRSGWFMGTYNSSYNVPALLTYIFAGFSPTNASYNGAASDGGTIGAVDYSSPSKMSVTQLSIGIRL